MACDPRTRRSAATWNMPAPSWRTAGTSSPGSLLALEDIRQQRESLDARLQALEETTEALKEVRSENEALRRDSVRSGTDLAEARVELDRARSDKAELNRSLNVAEETRHELDATVLQLIEEKRALTVNTQNELQGLRCELAETIVKLTKCRGEVQRLLGESDAKDLKVAQCRASMKELSTRHAELRSLLDRERQASVAANNARVQREREHQAATLLGRSLEQEIQRLEQESALQLAHARTGREAAEAEHGRTLAVLDKMTAELRRVQAELGEAKAVGGRVQAERDASTAEAQRAQAELDDATAENRRVQEELERANAERELLSAANQELHDRVGAQEEEIAAANREAEKYQRWSFRRFTG
jgi:chromosome segregation ATPase